MSTLPANLPDERTAQRLLDLLGQLEARLPQTAGNQAAQSSTQVEELERQLQTLKRKQLEARTRLQTLIDKLVTTQPAEEETQTEEAA